LTVSLCAFTPFVEEDSHWLNQYLAEVARLDIPFAVHFDRCTAETKRRVQSHPNFVGSTEQDDPTKEYDEQHKQGVLDLVRGLHYDWELHWDIDETWERDTPGKLEALAGINADYVRVHWVNCWGDARHVRVDGVFASSWRVKLYNLQARRAWRFDHPITYGCKLIDNQGKVMSGVGTADRLDIACLHHGLTTRELREFHKARWDRIYSTALRGDPNPLGFWNLCLDEVNHPPEVIPNPYI
jgi:hypothetical protein